MATATTTTANEVDDIRRQMARIRRELHEDVRGMVAGAEAVTDWKHYVKTYPWAFLGAAALLGFLIVPRRKKPALPVAEVARAVATEIPSVVQVEAPKKKGKGLIMSGLGLIAPVAIRALQGYATQFIGNWIAQQQGQMAELMAAAGIAVPPAAGGMPPGGMHPGGMPPGGVPRGGMGVPPGSPPPRHG